ncbi:MAG: non-ribosomal peptide synthetase, partial [Actinobacteria bacterium]
MTELDRRIAQMSPEKRELLLQRLREARASEPGPERITRRAEDGPLPLSFAQQRLWFLDQLAQGNPFYNADSAVRFDFPLNVSALERALNEIARRHESLRTRFVVVGGRAAQVVDPPRRFDLPVIDLSALPAQDRAAEARRLATEEARAPFDLARGPVVRTRLLKLDSGSWVFLLTMHHIVCDGWSVGLLFQELAALYEAFALGRRSPLPELPVQYPDFAL